MKLIKPYTTILNPEDFSRATRDIERAARVCYKSEDKIGENSDIAICRRLIKSGHEAMLEHAPSISVLFVCDRGVSHELVRHRHASFAQESTRYCNYSKDKFGNELTFIEPFWLKDIKQEWHEFGDYQMERRDSAASFEEGLKIAEELYLELIEKGWTAQQARAILPNALKTEIIVTANVREWRHIFELRAAKAAHPQMRELMEPLLMEFKHLCPVLFEDLIIK